MVAEQLKQQLTQSSMQREEIIRLKQELQLLHRDLLLAGPIHFKHKSTAGTAGYSVTFYKNVLFILSHIFVAFTVHYFKQKSLID